MTLQYPRRSLTDYPWSNEPELSNHLVDCPREGQPAVKDESPLAVRVPGRKINQRGWCLDGTTDLRGIAPVGTNNGIILSLCPCKQKDYR